MKIILNYNYLHPYTTGHYIKKVFDSNKSNYILKMHNQLNNKECEQFDLLLTIDDGGHTILPSFNITKAIWIIDTHVSFNYDILILLDYDFIFVRNKK